MNLSTMLQERAAGGRPIRVGLIGAGKFGSMLLAQAQRIPGFHVVGVADLDVVKARASLARVGWPAERYSATSPGDAVKTGRTCVLNDASALTGCDEIECIVEATGHPIAGVRHAVAAIDGGKHLIMVNVEADVLCGPLLAARALPIGLAHNVKLKRPLTKDTVVSFDDVELNRDLDVVDLRREMERVGAPPISRAM